MSSLEKSQKIKIVLEQLQSQGKINQNIEDLLDDDEKELVENIKKKGRIKESLQFLNRLNVNEDWNKVEKRLVKQKPVWLLQRSLLKYAAILIVFMSMSYTFWVQIYAKEGAEIENEIVLKLNEKEVQIIVQDKNEEIVIANGTLVGTQVGNSLVYSENSKVDKLIYNELIVPYGKIFNVKLSDGTEVYLNSGSSIKYPVKFVDKNVRKVFLKGEAYFKVAKNEKLPFIVNTEDLEVEVLGTEFNVSSYKEDNCISTVLVEGSVLLKKSNQEVILKPGYEGIYRKTNQVIDNRKVDLDIHVGWIKGELVFRKSSFNNMIKKIERRYDAIIKNQNNELNQKKFNARFNVNVESIEDIMIFLNKITPFKYVIQGNEIIITN